jgi:hypothetical protein
MTCKSYFPRYLMKTLFNSTRLPLLQADPNLLRLIFLLVSLSLAVLVGGAPEAGGGLQG